MDPQIKVEKNIQAKDYDLQVFSEGQSLVLRLIMIVSKARSDIYEKKLNSTNDIEQLGHYFTSLQSFRQYVHNKNSILIDTEKKSIKIIQRSKINPDKTFQIAIIPLQFSKIVNRDEEQERIDRILSSCQNKRELTSNELKDILQNIAIFLAQYSKEIKLSKAKHQSAEKRIQFLQQNLRVNRSQVQQKFIKYDELNKNKQEEFEKLKIDTQNKNDLTFTKAILTLQQTKQYICSQIEQIKQQQVIINQKINSLKPKDYQPQIQKLTEKINNEVKHLTQRIIKKVDDGQQKLWVQVKKIKSSFHCLQNLNSRKVIPDIAKDMKCQAKIYDLINSFENSRSITLQLQKGVIQLPQTLCDLISLQKLNLQNTKQQYKDFKLPKLADNFGRLTKLKYLKLYNCITDLTYTQIKKLKLLPELEELVIANSPLTKISKIQELTQLRKLTIYSTLLKQFPNVFKLPHLRTLDLHQNKLTQAQNKIIQMKELEDLNFSCNPLTLPNVEQLSKNLRQLKKLKKLDLSQLKLSYIPPAIFDISCLECLDLSSNQFVKIPSEICHLKCLRQLTLQNCCDLSQLPSQIGKLQNLEYLEIQSKKLVSIPAEIGNISTLLHLQISNITSIFDYFVKNDVYLKQIPKELGNLKNLKTLIITRLKIKSLPIQIFNLKELQELDVSQNQISELPAQIGNLKKLKRLNISSNKLINLPKQLSMISKSAKIIYDRNPFNVATNKFIREIKSQESFIKG